MSNANEYPGESAPLDVEGKKVFFKVHAAMNPDEDEKIDEASYDTQSYGPKDLQPYMIVMGYSKEKERMAKSLEEAKKILELRKGYGLSPVYEWEPHVFKEWKYTIPLDITRKIGPF